MVMSHVELAIEEDVKKMKGIVKQLKKKDNEILDILLRTKLLLDRQKIEDIKLTVSISKLKQT